MRLSTRTRYGTRFMVALAKAYGQGPILLREVASREQISEKYLSQIVLTLKAAGLIDAHRGSHGGYFLTRDPAAITLREIVEAFEKRIRLVECIQDSRPCERLSVCALRDIWEELSRSLSDALDRITLADLCARAAEKEAPLVYSI